MWDRTAIKQVNADTVNEERSKQGGKYHSTVRTVVSKDGKTMTANTKGTDANARRSRQERFSRSSKGAARVVKSGLLKRPPFSDSS